MTSPPARPALRAALHPRAEAHGKVILLGEHSVVYGQPALAAGLPQGLVLSAVALPDPAAPLRLSIPAWDLDLPLDPADPHPVGQALRAVLDHCGAPLQGWRIDGESCLPARAGLGSSAALTVALARLALGQDAPITTVVEASLVGERVFHGSPSGLDSEVAARGGVLRFVRGRGVEPVALATPLPLVVIPSGIPRSTAALVARVRDRRARLPALVDPILHALGAAVGAGIDALGTGDHAALGEIMDVSHELLAALGVSTPALDALCAHAREGGARGAKLTGAGGGGCVIAIPPIRTEPFLRSLTEAGLQPLSLEVRGS